MAENKIKSINLLLIVFLHLQQLVNAVRLSDKIHITYPPAQQGMGQLVAAGARGLPDDGHNSARAASL